MNEKKKHVIQVAKELFFEKGVTDYSVQEIIEKSGISKGTFYNYFSSKNEFFIDYLEVAKEDEVKRRQALVEGQSKQDKDILAEQILVRVKVNKEHTLIPIFEIAFYSGDRSLKEYAKKRYMDELHWLATRLVDIYGADARMYAADCSVLLHGMLQNIVQTYKIIGNRSIDFLAIIYYVLQQIDLVMKRMIIVQNSSLFPNQFIQDEQKDQIPPLEKIRGQLQDLQAKIPEAQTHLHESIEFLLEELAREKVRTHIVRPIVFSLKGMIERTEWANRYLPVHEQLGHYLYMEDQQGHKN